MDINTVFTNASNHARTLQNVPQENMLKLYGLYKQAIEGPCHTSKPYFWDMTANAKWKSWKAVSSLTEQEAKQEYISLVKYFDPSWDESQKSSGSLGVSVSTMHYDPEEEISDQQKTIFDWCEKGDLKQIRDLISKDHSLLNTRDEHGLTVLHWIVDRGFGEIAEYLISTGADVNAQDEEDQTPLHYAVTCEHIEIIKILLKSGANQTIKDKEGLEARHCSTNKEIISLLENNV